MCVIIQPSEKSDCANSFGWHIQPLPERSVLPVLWAGADFSLPECWTIWGVIPEKYYVIVEYHRVSQISIYAYCESAILQAVGPFFGAKDLHILNPQKWCFVSQMLCLCVCLSDKLHKSLCMYFIITTPYKINSWCDLSQETYKRFLPSLQPTECAFSYYCESACIII